MCSTTVMKCIAPAVQSNKLSVDDGIQFRPIPVYAPLDHCASCALFTVADVPQLRHWSNRLLVHLNVSHVLA